MASAVQICVPSGFLSVPDFLSLLDGQPNGLATILGFNYLLLQFIEPLAAFEELAYNLVATNEDAASGVLGGIVHVDANALEKVVKVGATEQQREPHLELRTPCDDYGVTAFGDGEGLQFLCLRWRAKHGFFRDRCLQFEGRGFESVAEVGLLFSCQVFIIYFLYNVELAYCIGLAFCYACKY